MLRSLLTEIAEIAHLGSPRSAAREPSGVNVTNRDGDSALHLAVRGRQPQIVRALLALSDIDVNLPARDQHGAPPLLRAAFDGHVPTLRLLLADKRTDVNARSHNGSTALMYAASSGHVAAIQVRRLPMDRPPTAHPHPLPPRARGPSRHPCCHRPPPACPPHLSPACHPRPAPAQELLRSIGVDLNAVNNAGASALIHAIIHGGPPAALKQLLSVRRLDVNADGGGTALMWAVRYGRTEAMTALLSDVRLNRDGQTSDGDSALHCAVRYSKHEALRLLIEAQCDLHRRNAHGATPLLVAEYQDEQRAVEMLLGAGADPTVGVRRAVRKCAAAATRAVVSVYAPLLRAAACGSREAVVGLLKHRADARLADTHGNNALMHAAAEAGRDGGAGADHVGVIELLLHWSTAHSPPALVNATNARGETAMHAAVRSGNHSAIAAIAAAPSVDLTATNAAGLTAIGLATELGVPTSVFGPCHNVEGDTALHSAVRQRDLGAIRSLLHERGADPEAVNAEGFTPLALARYFQVPRHVFSGA